MGGASRRWYQGGTGAYKWATALCLSGEVVLGGGHSIDPKVGVSVGPDIIVLDSRPATEVGALPAAGTEPRGWYAMAREHDTLGEATVTVWVLCGQK